MPRNQNAGSLALRNRNRVTNKTRLKVIKDNIDADPIVLDEDEERARVISTAGVDAEDANEHHLQAVLSAASHRATSIGQKATRVSSSDKASNQPESTAFIPVPDAAGLVENYEELYPPGQWTQPASYVKSSDTSDEYVRHALSDGFSYFMDERDLEWLEKNNKEAKGEGTSAQGSIASSGTTTRSSLRTSTKAKGKETDSYPPFLMQEDEFELVMGIFEKLTHDNTPFLHVNLQRGSGVPPFSSYEEHLSNDLPGSFFATFIRPLDIPQPAALSRMARAVYPHWKARRIEREGFRIIPILNFDESDTKNESYICFRRREIKAVRKTRTAQVSSSEKLVRLKTELTISLQLAQQVLIRENKKLEATREGQQVWDKRATFVDLKRKFPALGAKEDDELLVDKPKKPKLNDLVASQVLKIKNRSSLENASSPSPSDPYIRPRDRTNTIQSAIDEQLKKQKEHDHGWEDLIDNPFQAGPISFAERSFKSFNGNELSSPPRYLRLRFGRGGRIHLDRRIPIPSTREILANARFPEKLHGLSEGELAEKSWRLADRWKFDPDSDPLSSEVSLDDEDRVLVDDHQSKYLRHSIKLISEQDHASINTDPKLHLQLIGPEGMRTITPFRTSISSHATARRDFQAVQRLSQVSVSSTQHLAQQAAANLPLQAPSMSSSSGMPVSMQTAIRKMPPPSSIPQMRVPPNGTGRVSMIANGPLSSTPATSNNPSLSSNASTVTSPVNNIANHAHAMNTSVSKPSFPVQSNGGVSNSTGTAVSNLDTMAPIRVNSPARPQSRNQHQPINQQIAISNAFQATLANVQYNGFSNGTPNGFANNLTNQQHAVLNVQQAQNLKAAFGLPSNQGLQLQASLTNVGVPSRSPSAYAQLSNGANNTNINNLGLVPLNMTLKLPANRQMQLAAANTASRPQNGPTNGMNGIDLMPNSSFAHSSPNMMMRTPSANGHHVSPTQRPISTPQGHFPGQGQSNASPSNGHHFLAHSLSPRIRLSPQPQITPPRAMQTSIPSHSPSLQHQQIVSSTLHQGNAF